MSLQKLLSSSPLAVVWSSTKQRAAGVTSVLLFPEPAPWATFKKQFCAWFQDMGQREFWDTGLPRSSVHQIRGGRLRVCRALASQMSAAALLWVRRTHAQNCLRAIVDGGLPDHFNQKEILKNQVSLSTFPMETFSFRKQTQNQASDKIPLFPREEYVSGKGRRREAEATPPDLLFYFINQPFFWFKKLHSSI